MSKDGKTGRQEDRNTGRPLDLEISIPVPGESGPSVFRHTAFLRNEPGFAQRLRRGRPGAGREAHGNLPSEANFGRLNETLEYIVKKKVTTGMSDGIGSEACA
jgi:hypothetical protein